MYTYIYESYLPWVCSCKMKMNGSGCVFDNYGRVPETIYSPEAGLQHPVEEAVFHNQPKKLLQAVDVSVRRVYTSKLYYECDTRVQYHVRS